MKFQVSSLVMMGWLSMSSAAMASGTEAPSTGVGSWTPTALKALPYPTNSAVRLRATGEVMESYQGFVQRYNPYTDTWRVMNPVCSPGFCRIYSMVQLGSGQVLAIAGVNSRFEDSWRLKTYDPATDLWIDLPRNPGLTRADFSLTVLGSSNRALQAGGFDITLGEHVPQNRAEELDLSTQTWTPVASMNSPRSGHLATVLYSGKVLVVGGEPEGSATAEIYDPSKKTWTLTPPPPYLHRPRQAIRLNSGQVMVLVDGDSPTEAETHLYDPYNSRWLAGPPLPFAAPSSTTLLYSGEVLAFNDAGQAAVYDPAQNAWLPAASATQAPPYTPTFGVLLHTGQVLRVGGAFDAPISERFTR
ncbi:Kelch repeat-containing protein [Cystobacter fuscus]|uniref:Kelch repeat-containing protein n=1 Tax=Cystobacter fuscus TaxID=43 RepID=UPI002B28571D|nr:hypothetical protein F0U63_21180 [Cystobacter fuscus]